MEQQIPAYIPEDLSRIISRDFSQYQESEIRDLLFKYGTEARHLEVLRVQMACLKVSAGNIEKLKQAINLACDDFREILLLAEYKNLKAETPQENFEQLQKWLGRKF